MDRRIRGLLSAAAGAALLLAPGARAETRLRSGVLSGQPAEIEVGGLPRDEADAALGAAWIELARARDVLRSHEEAFVRAAGGPVAPRPEVWELLQRSQAFCSWSGGTVSALGGRLLELWGYHAPAPDRPTPGEIEAALASGRCAALSFDAGAQTVTAAPETLVDFAPFARGWAIDRAIEALRSAGAPTGLVRLGNLARGFGGGPEGKGWRWEFPDLPGLAAPLEGVYLRDRALALLRPDERPLVIAGDRIARWIDLRTGSPGGGLVGVAAVTGLAADAEALAWSMFALGPRIGIAKANELRPPPSVLWLVGTGHSPPLISETAWSAVPKR